MTPKILPCVVSLIAAGTIGLWAHAQNALGGGDALDRNLGVGQGIRNPEAGGPNFRERNLIVTGDVAGGRGFRGAVGYTAEGDFRGRLGSNDFFGFRADSALSNPQLLQLGTSYEQLRFGQDLGLIEFRRAGSAAPEAIVPQNPISTAGWMDRQRLDRQIAATSLALSQQQIVEPRITGTATSQDGQLLLFNTSSITGLTAEPANQNVAALGLSTFDAARLRQDVLSGIAPPMIGAPMETTFQLPQSDVRGGAPGTRPRPGEPTVGGDAGSRDRSGAVGAGSSSGMGESGRIDVRIQRDYQRILERVADRYSQLAAEDGSQSQGGRSTLDRLNQDYSGMRDRLAGRIDSGVLPPQVSNQPIDNRLARADQQTAAQQFGRSSQQSDSPETARADSTRAPSGTTAPASMPPAGTQPSGLPQQGPTPEDAQTQVDQGIRPGEIPFPSPRPGDPPKPVEAADFRAALRHGERIENLSGPMRDRFNELMTSAEQKLREGDYFVAERRFERALRFAPGHPMASVGSGHSQLGAGLYLSASLTLRTLLARHPEMIDATYAVELLPSEERMKVAVEALKGRLEDEDLRDRVGYAFLLAYIGHQTGDRDLITQGLDVMAESDPQNELVPLLRDIWLVPPEEAGK